MDKILQELVNKNFENLLKLKIAVTFFSSLKYTNYNQVQVPKDFNKYAVESITVTFKAKYGNEIILYQTSDKNDWTIKFLQNYDDNIRKVIVYLIKLLVPDFVEKIYNTYNDRISQKIIDDDVELVKYLTCTIPTSMNMKITLETSGDKKSNLYIKIDVIDQISYPYS